MTLNLIDKKMVVKNTVELQPEKTYIFVSEDCRALESYGVNAPGTYGQLNSSNNDYAINRKYLVNKNFYDNENLSSSIVDKMNNAKSNDNIDYQELKNKGILKDNTAGFKFGVEYVKQKYLIEDEAFYKKTSIKNLYKYYRENIQHRVIDPSWGFTNYNCLNFFSINCDKNTSKTHTNCLAYPNPSLNSKNIFDFFQESDELNLSFYINQNNTNIKGFHFNPGCVFFIEGIIGIYVVKGTNVDKNNLTNSFRILTVINDSINKKQEIVNFLNENIDSVNEVVSDEQVTDVSFYLSKDNILNLNHWHNISISLKKRNITYSLGQYINFQFNFYVDGKKENLENKINLLPLNTAFEDLLKITEKNFITVGNRFDSLENSDFLYEKLFSVNRDVLNDFVGPYSNKNISFGNNLNNQYFISEVNDKVFELNNFTEGETGDYLSLNTSFSLTAEVHDIRVYNETIQDVKQIICDNSIKDFSLNKLVFSLPVYYYDADIKKKTISNLENIISNSNSEEINNISSHHSIQKSPVNIYFSNKCLGHEVNVENFVYEFKNKVSPNIIFNNDLVSDQRSYNCLNISTFNNDSNVDSLSHVNSEINISSKKGESVNNLYRTKLYENESESININEFYYLNFFEYRNNFILPCDNGLQVQYRNNVPGYYLETDEIDVHYKEDGSLNLDFINLENLYKENIVFEKNNLFLDIINNDLNSYSYFLKELKSIEEREEYFVENNISFKENYDNFKNVSLNNYFRSNFALLQEEELFLKYQSRTAVEDDHLFLEKRYLNDLSNPVARKINDNISKSIASFLPAISQKNLDITGENRILYYKRELPLNSLNNTKSENFSKAFCISTQLFNRKLERESIDLFDNDLSGTFGCKGIRLKDDGKGSVYRANALTKHAEWNSVGHCLYKEGIITVLHPSLENFGETGYSLTFKNSAKLNVLELNLPAYAGRTNKTYNTSAIENLRLDESAFNSDEDFVYITDINLHDKNLNIVAKAKIVKPYAKKDTDNVLFRLKMDY